MQGLPSRRGGGQGDPKAKGLSRRHCPAVGGGLGARELQKAVAAWTHDSSGLYLVYGTRLVQRLTVHEAGRL